MVSASPSKAAYALSPVPIPRLPANLSLQGHGKLNVLYDAIARASNEQNFVVDLLIVCGDFQAVRNMTDLEVMSCPPKYREIGDFHEYYSGKRVAPVMTVFIGGNHEASSHNAELWVIPAVVRSTVGADG